MKLFLDNIPSEKNLHKMFYEKLKRLGFGAHHISEIYRHAKEVVEGAKRDNSSKPVLNRLIV
jgi:hypothetical protein